MQSNDNFYVLKDERGVKYLGRWLYRRSYNEIAENILDRKGNQLIGLYFNYDPQNPFSNRLAKQGLILCKSPDLHKRAVRIVRCHCIGNRQQRRAA